VTGVAVFPDFVRHDNQIHVSRRSLLGFSDFRRFLVGQFSAQLADAMFTIVVATTILFENESGPAASRLAQMVVSAAVPLVLAGPLAGIVTDRFSRRRILWVGQILRSLMCVILVIALITRRHELIVVLFGTQLCANRVLYTVRAASIRHLVRHHELVAADSLMLLAGPVAAGVGAGLVVGLRVLGPYIGLVMIAVHVASLFFYVSIAAVLGGGADHAVAPWREASQHLRESKARYAIVTTSLHRLVFGLLYAATAIHLESSLHSSGRAYAFVVSASGLGGFLGTWTAEWVNERIPRKSLTFGTFAFSAVVAGISALFIDSLIIVGACVCTIGFLFQNLRICNDATVQSNATRGAGGREFAVYDVTYNLLFLCGIVIALPLRTLLDTRDMVAIAATAFLLGMAMAALVPRTQESLVISTSSPRLAARKLVRSRAV
jgi:MFS family permease